MQKIKIIVDNMEPSKSDILSNQNFEKVLKNIINYINLQFS